MKKNDSAVHVSLVVDRSGREYASVRARVRPDIFADPAGQRALAKHVLQEIAPHLVGRPGGDALILQTDEGVVVRPNRRGQTLVVECRVERIRIEYAPSSTATGVTWAMTPGATPQTARVVTAAMAAQSVAPTLDQHDSASHTQAYSS